jgi:CDP-diacylglycerol--glycerol-3-phosphate 3-phosphatidyltransferase
VDLLSEKNLQKITVSSAYINFPEFFINKLKEIHCDVELITSAPQANSFYKAGMIKGNIPKFYRLFELNLLKKFKGKDNLHLYEFKRDGWTYHSKGIWFYENNKLEPNATLIGSSNYSKNLFVIQILEAIKEI